MNIYQNYKLYKENGYIWNQYLLEVHYHKNKVDLEDWMKILEI